jgi:UDP-2-acetamido-2,6-beta-L-arabino-hexul-4-ose reductase
MFPIHENSSGSFQEIAHASEIEFGQLSILTVNPSNIRGGHYHSRKKEWFCPIFGKGTLRLVDIETGKERNIKISEENREFYFVPPNYAHWVMNYSREELVILIIISEEYREETADTYLFKEKEK